MQCENKTCVSLFEIKNFGTTIIFHPAQGKMPPVEPVFHDHQAEERETQSKKATFVCDVCNNKLIVGLQQWQGE